MTRVPSRLCYLQNHKSDCRQYVVAKELNVRWATGSNIKSKSREGKMLICTSATLELQRRNISLLTIISVCPSCANVLITSRVPYGDHQGRNRFECRTCPFQYIIDKRYYERKELKGKEVEDIIGGKDAWKNADKTEGMTTLQSSSASIVCIQRSRLITLLPVQCANNKCDSTMAFFYQLQIRSADEPMTSFFRCVKCAKEWRE